MNVVDVPVEIRADVARHLIASGVVDPYDALYAALWPQAGVSGTLVTTAAASYCVRGHELTPENTYIRPNGRRQCRLCRSFHQRGRFKRRARKKEPCVHCGAPATAASDKGTGGLPTPRCKTCYLKQRKRLR